MIAQDNVEIYQGVRTCHTEINIDLVFCSNKLYKFDQS